MKNINYICCLFLSFWISSCSDFLEEEPKSLITTGNFYNNVSDATKALYGGYNNLGPLYSSLGVGIVSDLAADVFGQGGGAGGSQALVFDDFTFDASTDVLRNLYETHYTLINNVNTLLANMEGRNLGDERIQEIVMGEAKFLRALAYFNLVRIYGDVPLRTEPSTSTLGLDISRTPASEVYGQIVTDLTDAVSLLEEESLERGRINRIAAHSLLAKVYITTQNYEQALQQIQEVLGKRSLYPDYGDNFKIENENNLIESIFEVQYGLRPENSNIIQFLTPDAVTGHGFVYGVYKAEDELLSSFADNDQRKEFTFWNSTGDKQFDGYFIKKFNDGLLPGVQATDAGQINYPVIRYADVLLMFAEALNAQNNGPTPEAYDAVNQVRNRAGIDDLMSGLNQAAFLDSLLEERRREFVGEGHRWFDLKRNGKLNEKLSDKGFVAGKHEVWAIPQSALDANQNLTQNDGY